MSDFLPHAPLDIIKLRATLLQRLRGFFDARDFVEVTTPVLSADTVVDEHLDPLTTILFRDPCQPELGATRYLQTSPEFAMKRLLAAGMQRIYQIAPAFRGCESGTIHNTEFTMIEWYRVGDDMQAGMELLAELAKSLFSVDHVDRRSYASAFAEANEGLHPLLATDEALEKRCRTLRGDSTVKPAGLLDISDRGVGSVLDDSRDDCLNLLWSHTVEPTLGHERPIIIYDYPASQAALARVRTESAEGTDTDGTNTDDANGAIYEVAERFELYFRGVELANGYHELTDADELRKRNTHINELRAATGKRRLPEHSRLLAAMEVGLPDCAGVALGFDRAVMVALKKTRLDQVMLFTDENA